MLVPQVGMDVTIPGNGWRGNRYSANGGKGTVNGEKGSGAAVGGLGFKHLHAPAQLAPDLFRRRRRLDFMRAALQVGSHQKLRWMSSLRHDGLPAATHYWCRYLRLSAHLLPGFQARKASVAPHRSAICT